MRGKQRKVASLQSLHLCTEFRNTEKVNKSFPKGREIPNSEMCHSHLPWKHVYMKACLPSGITFPNLVPSLSPTLFHKYAHTLDTDGGCLATKTRPFILSGTQTLHEHVNPHVNTSAHAFHALGLIPLP